MPHVEASHFALPLAGTLQFVSQLPQCVGSLLVSMQALPHLS
jgi:hypothetical protein